MPTLLLLLSLFQTGACTTTGPTADTRTVSQLPAIKLTWCAEGLTTVQQALDAMHKVYVDNTEVLQPFMSYTCALAVAKVECTAVPSPTLLTALRPLGIHRVETTVVVAGKESARSLPFLLTVTADTVPPPTTFAVQCPSSVTQQAPAGSTGVTVTWPPLTTTGGTQPVTANANPPSGSVFPITITEVKVGAVDSSTPNKTATCSFFVTVTGAITPPPQPPQPSASCRNVNLSVSPAVLLTTTSPPAALDPVKGSVGARPIMGQQNFAAAVALMRNNGWAVEWAPTVATSLNAGYFWLMAWCRPPG